MLLSIQTEKEYHKRVIAYCICIILGFGATTNFAVPIWFENP